MRRHSVLLLWARTTSKSANARHRPAATYHRCVQREGHMTGAGLSRIPRGRMVQASEMARRTLERLEALRDEPVGPVQVARDTGLPRVRTATRDQFEIAIGWMRRVRIGDVGDELAGWIGTADIEIGY